MWPSPCLTDCTTTIGWLHSHRQTAFDTNTSVGCGSPAEGPRETLPKQTASIRDHSRSGRGRSCCSGRPDHGNQSPFRIFAEHGAPSVKRGATSTTDISTVWSWTEKNAIPLTPDDAEHRVEVAPEGDVFIDEYSRVDQPTMSMIHRISDGDKVMDLETADVKDLLASGWHYVEHCKLSKRGRIGG